ncbi:flagellar filament capping protein FliD [Novosphingobium sp. JCM 18896]|uniref:flagellar filament capping protein FliD n=1 Tax=Novosphingobium sp. JCM 18896 TaxID=2989731 RepID=UPI002222084D|nr:flagellar filament capping protein FliD [Novosphingobium sp. JCM 18896]MCW1428864.1 flagellar filament capping protein FliD [Novosphingobium sp. JCM 18896]
MATSVSSTQSVTQTATQQLLTSLGAGSGVDMAGLATSLAQAQFAAKKDRLTTQSEKLDAQISAASTLKSAISNLATSLSSRVRTGDLSSQPQLANSAVATATLSGTTIAKGSYSLEVTKLATSQTLASESFGSPTSPAGAGKLTISFGTVSGTSFNTTSGTTPLEIDVTDGQTLTDVANMINAKNAGITAYVSNTTDGAKLVLKGSTGAASAFKIDATNVTGDLGDLAANPATAAPERLITTAGDANFKLDGLAITSATNKVVDAIPGVELNLTGTNTNVPTTVTFSDPSSSITSAMTDLTEALNEIVTQLNTLTDAKTGELARDSGALALRRTMQGLTSKIIMPNAAEGIPRSMADLGLSIQKDGTFTLDTARLTATLKNNPQEAAAMFTNGLYGVDATISEISRNMSSISTDTKSYGATLGNSIAAMTAQKTKNTESLTTLSEKQELLRTQLVARFSASDSQVGASKSTLSFLKNQIAAWNGTSNS